MSNQNTVTVQLTVKDDGSVVMKQFGKNSEDALGKVSSSSKTAAGGLGGLKDSFMELTVKAAAAYMAISKAMEYMDQGAKASQAEASFRALTAAAGKSGDEVIAAMKRATNETIDDSDLMQKGVKAMTLNFTTDQIIAMAEMARLAARTTGESVGQAYENIVDAISTKMPKTLKRYALVTAEQVDTINQAMAEGETTIDLFSVAVDNMNKQLDKQGPLLSNAAEGVQQYNAKIRDVKENFGKGMSEVEGWTLTNLTASMSTYAVILASIVTMSSAPIKRWNEEIYGIKEAEAELARYQARLKTATEVKKGGIDLSSLGEVARRKAELETLKALDKDYFKSQEDNLKAMVDLMKAVGGDEYEITRDSLQKREELNAEYFQRMKKEMELEAAARGKADRDKISDLSYVAEKMKQIDAEVSSRAVDLARQRTALSIQAAQADIKNLQSRLGEYQTYYDSLKAKMDKNIEDEKKHLEELRMLRQQSVDIDKSTAALIAGIKGTDKSQSAQQQYEAARSALNSQYGSALNFSGQDEIKALEEYKQKVAALQQQFAQGVMGANNIFGKPQEILSAAKVAEDALSDIERATQNQKNALALLAEEKQKQIETDQQWGQVLQDEAIKTQGEMEKLKTLIFDISTQIQNMQKIITLTGDDQVSGVVAGITSRIEQLHALAARPIVLTTTMGGGGWSSGFGGSSSPNTNASLDLGKLDLGLDKMAGGTDYVPYTGNYQLHKGEAVIPAEQNRSGKVGGTVINVGGITLQIPAANAPQRPEDWRAIVRNYIVPEIKKLNS